MEADLNPKEKDSRNNSRSNDAPFFLPLFPTYSGPTENEHSMSPLPKMSPLGGGEEHEKKAQPDSKLETKVEVVTKQDLYKNETTTEATTIRSSEQQLSPVVSLRATTEGTGEGTGVSAEVKAKDKVSRLSTSAGFKAGSPTDPWQADIAKGYIKVAGEWKFFDKRLQTGFSTSLETDFAKAAKWSADWRTVYFPNGTLTPELALGLVIGDKGLTRKVEPSINIQLSNWLSLKAGVPITLGPDNKFNVTPGVGFTMSF